MSYVNIMIKGLAIGARQNGSTEIMLLHPPGHDLSIKITKRVPGSKPYNIASAAENEMSISKSGNTVGDAVVGGTSFTSLVNLADLHSNYGPNRTPPIIKPKSSTNMKISYLLVPTDLVYTTLQTTLNHEFWVYTHERRQPSTKTVVPIAPARLWKDFSFRFDLPDAASGLSLDFSAPFLASYRLVSGVDYDIEFDNDCGGTCGNDFGYYYELLEDKAGQKYSEIEEFPIRKPVPANPSVNSEASCNVIILDPPPSLAKSYKI